MNLFKSISKVLTALFLTIFASQTCSAIEPFLSLSLPKNLPVKPVSIGKNCELETGLYYFRNRMYSPELGCFISAEPLLDYRDGSNLYAWCNANYVNGSDPLGLWNIWNPASWGISNEGTERSVWNSLNPLDKDQGVISGATGFAQGAAKGAKSSLIGAAKGGLELAALGVDAANKAARGIGSPLGLTFNTYEGYASQTGQAISSGQLTVKQAATELGKNALTFGMANQVEAMIEKGFGKISDEEFSERVGGTALWQLGGALTAKYGTNNNTAKIQTRSDIIQTVDETVSPHLETIKSLDPNAEAGFRGSLARGTKGPHKGNAPFDPNDFDIDAYIVSDKLYNEVPKPKNTWRSGNQIKSIEKIQESIDESLKNNLSGLRKKEDFTFRIFSKEEFEKKVGLDERYYFKKE